MAKQNEPNEITVAQAKQAGIVKAVNPVKTYYATLQLGANRRWRQFGGGKWERDPSKDSPEGTSKGMRHRAAVHEIGPFSGKIINGLIELHNQWVAANELKEIPAGTIGRQVLISDIKETADAPLDLEPSTRQANTLRDAIATAVREAVSQVLTAAGGGQGK